MYNNNNNMDSLERNAVWSDEMASQAVQECQVIGDRLVSEIRRVSQERRTEWQHSIKVVASSMKESWTERVAIWEAIQNQFQQAFAEYSDTNN
jgi:hypothetical protein